MITVNGNDIAITREDDLRLLVRVKGTADPLTDTVLFTVKSSPRSEDKLVEYEFPIQQDAYGDRFVEIILSHNDTDLSPRVYWWDLRIIHHVSADEFLVETPMNYAVFEIVDVIGDPQNGPGPEPPQPVPIPEVVWTVNGFGPDESGNVDLGDIVYSVNHELPDESGNVQIEGGGTVKSVNGVEPDEYGNVQIAAGGTVKSVNGTEPDDYGNVRLTAGDVGALPDSTTVPTKTSELTNDSGFLTQHHSLSAYRTGAAQDVIDAAKADADDVTALENTVAGHTAALAGLGTASQVDTGTGAGNVPVLGGAVTGGGIAAFDANGQLGLNSGNIGSAVQPVYLLNGAIAAGNSYADELVPEYVEVDNISVAANSSKQIEFFPAKEGYTSIGIVGVFIAGSNTGGIAIQRFNMTNDGGAIVSIRNTLGSAATLTEIDAKLLYRKNS